MPVTVVNSVDHHLNVTCFPSAIFLKWTSSMLNSRLAYYGRFSDIYEEFYLDIKMGTTFITWGYTNNLYFLFLFFTNIRNSNKLLIGSLVEYWLVWAVSNNPFFRVPFSSGP